MKLILLFDVLGAFLIGVAAVIIWFPLILLGRIYKIFKLRRVYKRHRFMWLPSSPYQKVIDKGMRWGVLPYHTTCGGYFEYNYLFHLIADRFMKVDLGNNVFFYDYPIFCKSSIEKGIFRYSLIAFNVFLLNTYMSLFIFIKKIDLIGSGSPFFIGVNTAIFSFITGCPYYWGPACNYDLDFELNGLPKYIPSRRIALLCIRIACSCAAKLTSIRYDLKNYLVGKGVPEEKIQVIYNAIDLSVYEKKPDLSKLAAFKKRYTVVYAGRINRVNAIDHIIRCAPYIVGRIPNITFIILGGPLSADDKGYFQECRALLKELEVEQYFSMTGTFTPNEEVADFKMGCDINLVTMGGISLIESAASGKPVITYDFDWHPELIEHEKNGLLVEYKNYKQMAEYIYTLYRHPALGKQYAEAALQTVLERHTIEKETENIIAFCEGIYRNV